MTEKGGLIVNTVCQITDDPKTVMVAVNKSNHSHDVIMQSGKMNVCTLTEDTPFSVIEKLGFKSGRDTDKLSTLAHWRSGNGLPVLRDNVCSFFSLEVIDYKDMGTHGMFICEVTEDKVITDARPLTYAYYRENIKPKPQSKGYVCRVCGYVYNGEPLPDDFICPICKHGASDFEKID